MLGDRSRNDGVAVERFDQPTPGVETELHRDAVVDAFATWTTHHDGPGVAHPGIVYRQLHQRHAGRRGRSGLAQLRLGARSLPRVDHHRDRLVPGHGPGNVGPGRAGGLEVTAEERPSHLGRPGDQGALVPVGLGGHHPGRIVPPGVRGMIGGGHVRRR
jgi:hypothetical protein